MTEVRPTDDRSTLVASRSDAKGTCWPIGPMVEVHIPNVLFPKKTEGWTLAEEAGVPLSSVELHNDPVFPRLCANPLACMITCASDFTVMRGRPANGVL